MAICQVLIALELVPVFGNLTVTGYVEHRKTTKGKSKAWYSVKCLCGRTFEKAGSDLKNKPDGICRFCSYDKRRGVKTGARFGRLTVIGVKPESGHAMLHCKCDCGKDLYIRSHSLVKNKTNHCGCDVRGKWIGIGDLARTRIYRLKRGAEERGLTVDVTLEQLWELYLRQGGVCALSGIPIPIDKKSTTFIASVDRINSDISYTLENIQWVHKDINKMKMDFTQERFIELCKMVASHNAHYEMESAA